MSVTAGPRSSGLTELVISKYSLLATPAPSSTTLVTSSDTLPVGSAATFTATVAPPAGGVPATGSVRFYDSGVLLGSALVQADGTANLSTEALFAGYNSVTAAYSGDLGLLPSTSAALTEEILSPPGPVATEPLRAGTLRAMIRAELPRRAVAGVTAGRAVLTVKNPSTRRMEGMVSALLYVNSTPSLAGATPLEMPSFGERLIIRPGAGEKQSIKIALPAVPTGDYYLLVVVTAPDGTITEAASQTTIVVTAPSVGLSIRSTRFAAKMIAPSKGAVFNLVLENTGNTELAGSAEPHHIRDGRHEHAGYHRGDAPGDSSAGPWPHACSPVSANSGSRCAREVQADLHDQRFGSGRADHGLRGSGRRRLTTGLGVHLNA